MCCGREEEEVEEMGKRAAVVEATVSDGQTVTAVRYVGYGSFLLGVPARDLTAREWAALTDTQRQSAVGSGLYVVEQGESRKEDGV
jgi:hypothetical protein